MIVKATLALSSAFLLMSEIENALLKTVM